MHADGFSEVHDIKVGFQKGLDVSGEFLTFNCRVSVKPAQGLIRAHPAEFEQPANGLFNQVVRTGGACCDAHGDIAVREPVGCRDFIMFLRAEMDDLLFGFHFAGIFNEECR